MATKTKKLQQCVLCLSFISLGFNSYGQKTDTLVRYLNEDMEFTSAKNMAYKAKAFPYGDGYLLQAFYPHGSLMTQTEFADKKMVIKDGPYISYYPDGKTQVVGRFENNMQHGNWKWYYPNGSLKDSGAFKLDKLVGKWISWYPNGQVKAEATYAIAVETKPDLSSPAAQKSFFKQGAYKAWYENGVLEAEGNFDGGQKTGTWKWFHPNGNPSTIEQYNEQGKVVGMTCFDSTGVESGDFCSLERPAYLKGVGNFKEYFFSNFFWTKEVTKQKEKGTVWVTIKIAPDGSVKNLRVEGTTEVLAKAVHAFIKGLPGWEPAISHNRFIEWTEELEVKYEKKPKTLTWDMNQFENLEPLNPNVWESY